MKDDTNAMAPPPAESPALIRVKVTCGDSIKTLSVVDAETGRPIPVFAIDWHADFQGNHVPKVTLKTYLRAFEYEGPATLFTYCPKCKEEVKVKRNPTVATHAPTESEAV